MQNKYVGTGHPDITRQYLFIYYVNYSEFAVNHHRDTIASHMGHIDMLYYFALAENVPVERCRYELFEVLLFLLF